MAEIRGLTGRKPVQQPEQPGVWEQMFANLVGGVVGGGVEKAMDVYAETEYIMPAKAKIEDESAYNKMAREGYMQTGQTWPTYAEYRESGLPEDLMAPPEGRSVGGIIGARSLAEEEKLVAVEEAKEANARRKAAEAEAGQLQNLFQKQSQSFLTDVGARVKALGSTTVTRGSNKATVQEKFADISAFMKNLAATRKIMIENPEMLSGHTESMFAENQTLGQTWRDILENKRVLEISSRLSKVTENLNTFARQGVRPVDIQEIKNIENLMAREAWNQTYVQLSLTSSRIEASWIRAGYVVRDVHGTPILTDGTPTLLPEYAIRLDNMFNIVTVSSVVERLNSWPELHGITDPTEKHWATAYGEFSELVKMDLLELYEAQPNNALFRSKRLMDMIRWIKAQRQDPSPESSADPNEWVNDPGGSLGRLVTGVESREKRTQLSNRWRGSPEKYPSPKSRQFMIKLEDHPTDPYDNIRNLVASAGDGVAVPRPVASDRQQVATFLQADFRALVKPFTQNDFYERMSILKYIGGSRPEGQRGPITAEDIARYEKEIPSEAMEEGVKHTREQVGAISDSVLAVTEGSYGGSLGDAFQRRINRHRPRQKQVLSSAILAQKEQVGYLAKAMGVSPQAMHIAIADAVVEQGAEAAGVEGIDRSKNLLQRMLNTHFTKYKDRFSEEMLNEAFAERVYSNLDTILTGSATGRPLTDLALPLDPEQHGPGLQTREEAEDERGVRIQKPGIPVRPGDLYRSSVELTAMNIMWIASDPGANPVHRKAAIQLLNDLKSTDRAEAAMNFIGSMARWNALNHLDVLKMDPNTGILRMHMGRFREKFHTTFHGQGGAFERFLNMPTTGETDRTRGRKAWSMPPPPAQ